MRRRGVTGGGNAEWRRRGGRARGERGGRDRNVSMRNGERVAARKAATGEEQRGRAAGRAVARSGARRSKGPADGGCGGRRRQSCSWETAPTGTRSNKTKAAPVSVHEGWMDGWMARETGSAVGRGDVEGTQGGRLSDKSVDGRPLHPGCPRISAAIQRTQGCGGCQGQKFSLSNLQTKPVCTENPTGPAGPAGPHIGV